MQRVGKDLNMLAYILGSNALHSSILSNTLREFIHDVTSSTLGLHIPDKVFSYFI